MRFSSKADVAASVGKAHPDAHGYSDPSGRDDVAAGGLSAGASLIDEIVREGARPMLAQALQAEVDVYIAQFADERDERDHRLVVRNGHHGPRQVLTGAG